MGLAMRSQGYPSCPQGTCPVESRSCMFLLHRFWEHKMWQPLWKNRLAVLPEGKPKGLLRPSDFAPIYPREMKTDVHSETWIPATVFIKAPKWRQPKCPSPVARIQKMWSTYMILSGNKQARITRNDTGCPGRSRAAIVP